MARPNWKKDKRKPRLIEGKCAIAGCKDPSVISYLGCGLCERHEDYYLNEDMPAFRLRSVLGIKVPQEREDQERALWEKYRREEREEKRRKKRTRHTLDDWEHFMFEEKNGEEEENAEEEEAANEEAGE